MYLSKASFLALLGNRIVKSSKSRMRSDKERVEKSFAVKGWMCKTQGLPSLPSLIHAIVIPPVEKEIIIVWAVVISCATYPIHCQRILIRKFRVGISLNDLRRCVYE